MATQSDPLDRTRCAKKFIVILELYGRIFREFYIKKLGSKENLLKSAREVAKKLNKSQREKIEQGVDGIDTWDISLFWAIHWQCNIDVDNDTTDNLDGMKNMRNYSMHVNRFEMSENEAIHFFRRAEEFARYFDAKHGPGARYKEQLDEIKRMHLDSAKEHEVLEKIRAEEEIKLVRTSGKIMIYIGKRFQMKKSAKKEKLVAVINEENKEHVKKIQYWLKTLGRKFRKGDYTVEYVKTKMGSIIVEIIISKGNQESIKEEELYDLIAAYIQKAYEESKITLSTPVDVVLFVNEYDDN